LRNNRHISLDNNNNTTLSIMDIKRIILVNKIENEVLIHPDYTHFTHEKAFMNTRVFVNVENVTYCVHLERLWLGGRPILGDIETIK